MKTIVREILLGFWKVHILHHAAERPVYGQWIMTELRRHGYDISPGTLYPLLDRMARHGWLRCERPARARRPGRKNYSLTPQGQALLETIKGPLRELHDEVVTGALPRLRRHRS